MSSYRKKSPFGVLFTCALFFMVLLLFKVNHCSQTGDDGVTNCTLKSYTKLQQACSDDGMFCLNITYTVKVMECPVTSQRNCTDSEKNTTRRVCIEGSTHCLDIPVSDEITKCVNGSLSISSEIQSIGSSSNVYISGTIASSVYGEIQSVPGTISEDMISRTTEISNPIGSSVYIEGGASEITESFGSGTSTKIKSIDSSTSVLYSSGATVITEHVDASSVYGEIEFIDSSISSDAFSTSATVITEHVCLLYTSPSPRDS